jgi:hypothetical protein
VVRKLQICCLYLAKILGGMGKEIQDNENKLRQGCQLTITLWQVMASKRFFHDFLIAE